MFVIQILIFSTGIDIFQIKNYFWTKKIPILSEKTEKNNVNRVKIYVKNVGGGLTLKCV